MNIFHKVDSGQIISCERKNVVSMTKGAYMMN